MHGLSIYFILTVLMFSISPGPAMMFVLQQSQKNGVKTGLAAVLGTEIGVFIYVILTALGISTVLKQYPSIYTSLQGIGAAICFTSPTSAGPVKMLQTRLLQRPVQVTQAPSYKEC